MRNLLLLGAFAMLLTFSNCKKSTTNNNNNNGTIDITGKTKREIFKIQPWKFQEWMDSAENDEIWTDNADPHQLDDIYTFISNTKISINDGTKKNPGAATNPYEEDWNMGSDNASIVTIAGIVWDIKSMSATKIVLWRKFPQQSLVSYQRMIFVK